MNNYGEILSMIEGGHIEHIKSTYTDNVTEPIKERINFLISRGFVIHSVQNSRGDTYTLNQQVIKNLEKDSIETIDRKITKFEFDRTGKVIAYVESLIIEKFLLTEIDSKPKSISKWNWKSDFKYWLNKFK